LGVKIDKHNLELIVEFAKNDFKLKYKNSFFGYLWSVLNPLLMLLTLYLVFTYAMNINLENYQLSFLLGIIIWNYFSESTMNSLNSIIGHTDLIKKNNIEPIIFPLSSCLSSLFSFMISFCVFLFLGIFFGLNLNVFFLMGFFYLVPLLVLSAGVSILLVTIYSYFKDITHIWSFSLLIGFWITPIIYSEMIFSEAVRRYYMLNPMARIISHCRNAFLYGYPDGLSQILLTIIISLIILFSALWIYEQGSKKFVEKI